jgi:hypothetical protein
MGNRNCDATHTGCLDTFWQSHALKEVGKPVALCEILFAMHCTDSTVPATPAASLHAIALDKEHQPLPPQQRARFQLLPRR